MRRQLKEQATLILGKQRKSFYKSCKCFKGLRECLEYQSQTPWIITNQEVLENATKHMNYSYLS